MKGRWWYLFFAVPLLFLRVCLRSSSSTSYRPLDLPTLHAPDLSYLGRDGGFGRGGFKPLISVMVLSNQARTAGLTDVEARADVLSSALRADDCGAIDAASARLETAMRSVSNRAVREAYASVQGGMKGVCEVPDSTDDEPEERVFTERLTPGRP